MLQTSMSTNTRLARISDEALLNEATRAAANERQATAGLIALLAEIDVRRLYLSLGCSSLFTYCTQVLHLSEHAAYGRIEAARAARLYPTILQRLEEGALTLTAVGILRQHLTPENHRAVLDAAHHKSKRQIEELVASLHPQPPVPSTVRKLPSSTASTAVTNADGERCELPLVAARPFAPDQSVRVDTPAIRPGQQSQVKPLAPERYKIQFTVSSETHAKLRQVQNLLRHSVPSGDPAEIFDRALTMLLERLQRTKLAVDARGRTWTTHAFRSRHIPAAVRRAVWTRDGGRCAFVGTHGRCTETSFIEFHHVEPYATGGAATAENIQLRCRAHNVYEAELFFGPGSMVVREARGFVYPADSARTEL